MEPSQPAYLVKGDDPTLVDQALDSLIVDLTGDNASQLVIEEISQDAPVSNVLDICQTAAFLSDRRIVLVRNAGRFKADEVQPLVEYLASPMPTTLLVLGAGGGAMPTRLTKAVKDHGHIVDATTPMGKGRTAWVQDHVRNGPVKLDSQAVAVLTEHLGEELGQLEGILDAIAAAHGEGARISVDQMEPFIGAGGAAAPWELTDAIDSGDATGALVQLHRMLGAGGRHPLVVMATLSRHVSTLLRLDGADVTNEAEAASLLGIAAYPAKKAMTQSRRLGSEAIMRATKLASEADADLRGGSAWPNEIVLEVLVARLAKLVPVSRSTKRPAGRRVD